MSRRQTKGHHTTVRVSWGAYVLEPAKKQVNPSSPSRTRDRPCLQDLEMLCSTTGSWSAGSDMNGARSHFFSR